LEPSVSGMTDGLTPACSMADIGLLPTAAAAAKAAVDSSSSSGVCPQIIFLSQNDPGENAAALLRSVEGVVSVDLTGLQLSSKVRPLSACVVFVDMCVCVRAGRQAGARVRQGDCIERRGSTGRGDVVRGLASKLVGR
jgi:hypothetical protein